MNKLQAEITRRAAERGQQGAKKLVDMIISNLDASLSSGLFIETDAVSVKQLKLDLKEGILEPLISAYSFFDPQTGTIGATFLWHLIGTVYRAGQVTPNAMIAEDILGPGIVRKAASKKGSSGGSARAEKQKPKVDAKHAKVLLIMGAINSKMPKLSKRHLAIQIGKKLPKKMALSDSRIREIIRASESGQSTG
jgi:hypothetical protein